MKRLSVALLRGWYLNPWEMMRYHPLKNQFQIVALGTYKPLFDLSEIGMDIRQFHWPGEVFYRLGKAPAQLINRGLYKYVRYNQWMIGLENELRNFDVIHSADTHHIFSLQAARTRKKYGNKLVLTIWENIPFQDEKRGIYHKISREVINNTDLFLPVTSRSREMLLIEGVSEDKIEVIPQPVDIEMFKPRRKDNSFLSQIGCKKDQPVIFFIGRLHKTKGVEYLLYALKRLLLDKDIQSTIPKILIVGTGEREKTLKQLIARLDLTRHVLMFGGLPHRELIKYYTAADIFVLPSIPTGEWQEQFGMVLVEAMACGKPVIATQSGSIPDVIGDAGILVQPADFYSLYKALKQLILTPDLCKHYSTKARERAENVFSSVKIAGKTAAAYQRLMHTQDH